MRRLGVTARCVFDLDVLLTPEILAKTCAALGFEFAEHRQLLAEVSKAIKVPPAAKPLQEIERIVAELNDDEPSRVEAVRAIKRIAETLGKSWVLKSSGLSALPKGQLNARVRDLLEHLRQHGIVILEDGEIENYVPEVGGHGQSWVRSALEVGKLSESASRSLRQQFAALTH